MQKRKYRQIAPKHRPPLAAAALVALAQALATAALAAGANGGIQGFEGLSLASSPAANAQTCATATRAAEINHGLPDGLMTAIASVESGQYDPVLQVNIAWPWTINAEGSGAQFDSKGEAIAQVRALLDTGMESIDVGCMQVNLRWHPDAFASLEDAFDPALNADYAARLLISLFNQHGNWPAAIGHYHSGTDWRQANYQGKVAEAWAALGGTFAGLPVAATATPVAAAVTGPTLFGGLVATGPSVGGGLGLGGGLGVGGGPSAGGSPGAAGGIGAAPLIGTTGGSSAPLGTSTAIAPVTPSAAPSDNLPPGETFVLTPAGQNRVASGTGAGMGASAGAGSGTTTVVTARGTTEQLQFFPLPAR